MRYFKIAFSIAFVLFVAFLVVRGCSPKKKTMVARPPVVRTVPKPKPPKKIVVKKTPAAPVKAAPAPAKTEKTAKRTGRLAIVLDDWGNHYSLVNDAVSIGRPLTLAILPNLPHSRDIAEEAFANGLGVMLHMPMQPQGTGQPLEPQTILTSTPEAEIIRYLDEALASVPHVTGINNHMGSAATSDARVMKTVLAHLKKKKLFFVDSNVIATTQGPVLARQMGLRFTKRDVFLDNELELEAVKTQLREAKNIALSAGSVVAIGHDKKVTLEAIREVAADFEKEGVHFVLVKELLE